MLQTLNRDNNEPERSEYDIGLSNFLSRVYTSASYSILTTVITIQILMYISEEYILSLLIVGLIGSLISCFVFEKIGTEKITDESNNKRIYYCIDPTSRKCAFYALSIFIGIMITPLVIILGSKIFYTGLFASSIVFCTMTLFSYWKPHFIGLVCPILILGLFILSSIQILGLIITFLIGTNNFSTFIHSVDIIYGSLLFTGLIAYDTYKAVQLYTKEKNADHLLTATSLYLDFMNLLVRLMEIIEKITKK